MHVWTVRVNVRPSGYITRCRVDIVVIYYYYILFNALAVYTSFFFSLYSSRSRIMYTAIKFSHENYPQLTMTVYVHHFWDRELPPSERVDVWVCMCAATCSAGVRVGRRLYKSVFVCVT
ncbi:unnamed protein product [Aphis gossypii]|uniref:Transmembrane protein n=1 Tax=Aphis gossypii TaxID=80765 RepID=A0A9P0IQ43_APHGO|nr:unnamed protein product [Aphis gossypii]